MSSYSTSSVNTQNYKPLSLQELEQRDRFVHRHILASLNMAERDADVEQRFLEGERAAEHERHHVVSP